MRPILPRVLVMLAGLLATHVVASARGQTTPTGADVFKTSIEPVLTGKCLACHSSETRKGGLDLTTRASALSGGESGPAIVPGEVDESLLIEKLAGGEMPPKNPLTAEQVEAFRAWVRSGAAYAVEPLLPARAGADWWSLQPIAPATPRAVAGAFDRHNPIDPFIQERLWARGLSPGPEADRRTLIRRVTFDLTGLPPTPEEIDDFEGDTRPDAYERLVDRLLASPAFGERAGRLWLDVARFAESHGYETNALRPNAWPYRDYVIRAHNEDTPFGRFVEEQFAGDGIAGADWLTAAATGFLVGGTHDVVANLTEEGARQQRADDLDDVIAATGAAFLGMTISCARCHDHKFDPITQADYYGLKAIFSGMRHEERRVAAPDIEQRRAARDALERELAALSLQLDATEPLAVPDRGEAARPAVNAARNVERIVPLPARFVRFTVQATNNGIEPCIDELEVWTAGPEPENVALASKGARALASSTYPNSTIHRLEHIYDGAYGNSRSWISAAAGKGWVQVELAEPVLIDRIVWGRDRDGQYRDRLPTEYYIEAALEPGRWRVVASSADRVPWSADGAEAASIAVGLASERAELLMRQADLRKRLEALGETVPVYAGAFGAAEEVRILPRGGVMASGPVASPSGIRVIRPVLELSSETSDLERRRALAAWIADPQNPLPARVVVNRIWQQHFGRGLVVTSADFGFNGEKPTHPELLDWLAWRFWEFAGEQKPIHRLIVLSAAYRQASEARAEGLEKDALNQWLWRAPGRRLDAESIRDAMLSAAGTLDRRMGGPGYWIWKPNTNYVVVFDPLEELGREHWRRMVYQYKPRSQPDIVFGSFDCPDSALPTARRNVSTTALQALNLLNSRFVLDQAERFAGRIRAEVGTEPGLQVDRAFRLAFGRPPWDQELRAAVELVHKHGLTALTRALFNANEFIYVD